MGRLHHRYVLALGVREHCCGIQEGRYSVDMASRQRLGYYFCFKHGLHTSRTSRDVKSSIRWQLIKTNVCREMNFARYGRCIFGNLDSFLTFTEASGFIENSDELIHETKPPLL
jgi:hypothetical protein